jgi:hypothetical protein
MTIMYYRESKFPLGDVWKIIELLISMAKTNCHALSLIFSGSRDDYIYVLFLKTKRTQNKTEKRKVLCIFFLPSRAQKTKVSLKLSRA